MIKKIKAWLFGSVIMKKVIGKFAKHATGAIVALLASPKVSPYVEQLGVTIDSAEMEAGLTVILIGLFGSLWNFIEHRIKK